MANKTNLQFFNEEQIENVSKKRQNWFRIKFPDTEKQPVYVTYDKRPSKDEISDLVSSIDHTIQKYEISGIEFWS